MDSSNVKHIDLIEKEMSKLSFEENKAYNKVYSAMMRLCEDVEKRVNNEKVHAEN